MIQKINRMTLVEQVVEQIEQLIEQGKWKVGDKLPPEMELMNKFDVSRNTLREAIRALVHAGLLETKQGSGTLVRSTSSLGAALKRHAKKTTMLETLEVRLALEKQAAQMASELRTHEDLAQMNTYIQKCKDAMNANEMEQFITSDIEFHKTIVRASGNQLLIDLYDNMTDILYSFVYNFMAIDPSVQLEVKFHTQLFEAIKEQDQQSAQMYVENDMEILKERVVRMMED